MRISVIVKPNAREEGVEKLSDGEYRVAVKAPAQEGKANAAVVRVLAEHFGVPKSAIQIKVGQASRRKLVEVEER